MLKFIDGGDILASSEAGHTIVIPVNCQGVMGKGLAKDFAKKYPLAERAYKELCSDGLIMAGHAVFLDPDRSFIAAATKDNWRESSQYGWVFDCFRAGAALCRTSGVDWPVDFSALGCGLGGLKWDKVKHWLDANPTIFRGLDVRIHSPR